MRKVILFLSFMLLVCVSVTHGQAVFRKYGFKKAPLTLSKGKYNEFFTNDEVVQIGTVRFNTRTNKVIELLEEDTTKTNYLSDRSSIWYSVDPLAEKYPNYSPYVYCANNPVKFIDPDGKKIVYFNGYLGFGSPVGGKEYWNSGFIRGAAKFFNDYSTPYFTNIDHKTFSTAAERQADGYEFAKQNYGAIIEGMKQDEPFRLIGHSMGSAEATGAKKYLEEKGWKVESMVLLASFQSDDIKIDKKNGTMIVDYQNTNDPVLYYLDPHYWTATGEIKNADFKIREESKEGILERHRDPIDSGEAFWNNIVKKCTETKN
jgi:RHS repeat-associated protein